MYSKLLLLLSAGLVFSACASENGEDQVADAPPTPTCNTANVTYTLTVAPLLQKSCTSCHNSNFASGGVNLSTYARVRTVALNGRLIGSVNHEAGYSPMPKGGTKLPDCDISQLRKWVEDGAIEN
ncbi:hypothetical protein MTX78_18580 [Hymenobacter tibetensis]|uniref:Cytochrome c domain-containing protein n=1 Tax=Hymenobacter tibetensis TaxID=497967 RepID=A0ABY4CYR1_9BACT|nr:hypothetical protein [Hymenobacter tibetensis]UOG74114.1 hypothetical protein MTX78_18580 [Hymenobacter tibetensis]